MTARRRLSAVPDEPRRGVALIRVSKVGGREDLASPDIQRVAIEDYARGHGIDVLEWVEALDESASKARSAWWPRLWKAVGQVEAGERDVVLVWKVSRAARHRRNWAVAVDRIEVAGGTIESATEGLDTTTSTGRLARGVLAELAAWEAETKSEQWKEAQARRIRNGLPHGGHRRFGYTYDHAGGYQLHDDESPLLAELYRAYLRGDGFARLADRLNRAGVPPVRSARGWTVQAVITLLDSGFGAGLLRQRRAGEWLPGVQPTVISPEEWEQYRLQRRLRATVPARVQTPSYALTGLVKCGLCRYALVATSDRRQGPGYLYRCTAHVNARNCPGVWITRTAAEQAVREWLRAEVADVDRRAATKTARAAAAAALRAERKALTRELAGWDAKLERARRFLIDETLTREEYLDERERLDARRREIAKRMDELGAEQGAMTGPMLKVARGLLADWDVLSVKTRRDMLASMIRRVEVRPGGRGHQLVRVRPLWEPDVWS